MRQVPGSYMYLLIGDGRLARHLTHYFNFESIPFDTWKRAQGSDALAHKAANATHILLAISDASIASFYKDNAKFFEGKTTLHFSGSLVHPEIPSPHPLMTFSQDLYDPATYRRVPFITEKGRADFGMLLPGLKNASYGLDAEQKGLYHALCVMSGNFTVLLWEKAFKEFETLGLPRMTLLPYLERIALNLISSRGQSVLTGPLARGDGATIANNIEALDGDKFQDVYRAFVSATQNTIPTNAQSEGDVL